MKSHRLALYLLPLVFAGVIFFGQPAFETLLLLFDVGEHDRRYWRPTSIVLINSFILHFWLLALASGQPVYKPWKAVLALNLAIILPGWSVFLFSYIAIATVIGAGELFPYLAFLWTIIVLLLIWGCHKLLCSRLFSPYIGESVGDWHTLLMIVAMMTILLHNALIYYSVLASL